MRSSGSPPTSTLKIDRSFVDGVTVGREESAVAKAIINLARALDLRTIAEGIAAAEQAQALSAFGCHFAQGYYVCPPLGTADLLDHLRDRNAVSSIPDRHAHGPLAPNRT